MGAVQQITSDYAVYTVIQELSFFKKAHSMAIVVAANIESLG